VRKKANDVKRGGWSAHRLADESGYAIDTKQKLKQGDADDDDKQLTQQAAPPPPPVKTAARRKKRSAKRPSRSEQ
jgi:hypothetical protein